MEQTTTEVAVGDEQFEVTVYEDGEADVSSTNDTVIVLDGWSDTANIHIKPDKMEEVTIVPQEDKMDFCAYFETEHVAETSPTVGANNSVADYSEEMFWYFTEMRFEQL